MEVRVIGTLLRVSPFVSVHETGNQFGDAAATALAPALQEMKGLKRLRLHSTCVGSQCLRSVTVLEIAQIWFTVSGISVGGVT